MTIERKSELVNQFVKFSESGKTNPCKKWMPGLTKAETRLLYDGLRIRWQSAIELLNLETKETV